MNKKLLALAIGAAVAMPVVALAEGPTLYGKLDVTLLQADVEVTNGLCAAIGGLPGSCDADAFSLENNASRIGVKGALDTNVDGLKGVYLAEFGVDADDGSTPLTGRNIYVGLNGGFGTVLAGNIDTPLKSAQGKVDQFNDTYVDMADFVAGELRAPNAVAYASPKLGDAVTVTVALWQGEGATIDDPSAFPVAVADGIADAVSASIVYDKDNVYLALAMDKETPANSGLEFSVFGCASVGCGSPLTVNDLTRVVAGYTSEGFEVGALYQVGEDSFYDIEETSMLLSGAIVSGDMKFKAQFISAESEGNDSSELEGTSLSLGVDYAVGKATTISALVATMEVEAASLPGESIEGTAFGVGLQQKF